MCYSTQNFKAKIKEHSQNYLYLSMSNRLRAQTLNFQIQSYLPIDFFELKKKKKKLISQRKITQNNKTIVKVYIAATLVIKKKKRYSNNVTRGMKLTHTHKPSLATTTSRL